MPFFLLAVLLGMLTYWVIKRSVATITRTPVWLLWFVMMVPVFVLTLWAVFQGTEEPPILMVYGLFILSPILYAFLIAVGRLPKSQQPQTATPVVNPKKPVPKPITRDEETTLQQCFPWSVFYLQDIEYRAQMMICRGQLKAASGLAYQTVQRNIHNRFDDRFLVMFQEGPNGKPFFVLVPNSKKQPRTMPMVQHPAMAIVLLVATLVTTTLAGLFYIGELTVDELQATPTLIWQGVAYGASLMLVLGVHELGHYLMARRYRISATPPYFIPVPFFLGTFGAFIQLRQPFPHRRALFDVGIAGPLAGVVATLPVLLWGLAHSSVVELTEDASLLNFHALDPTNSILLVVLSKLALGSELLANSAIDLHPVAVAGFLGLVVTALNLMPVGQLDGGHIVHAMYGQRMAALIGQISRFLVLILAFIHPEFWLWAILLFFMPSIDEPALNDVSELDQIRDFGGLLALTLLVIIVLPAPQALTQALF